MSEKDTSKVLTPDLIREIVSDKETLDMLLNSQKDQITLKDVKCDISDLPEDSELRFVLCDVGIDMDNTVQTYKDEVQQLKDELDKINEQIEELKSLVKGDQEKSSKKRCNWLPFR